MDFRLSPNAEWEMTRRGIPPKLVQAVMDGGAGFSLPTPASRG
jgi:hypothetical protein